MALAPCAKVVPQSPSPTLHARRFCLWLTISNMQQENHKKFWMVSHIVWKGSLLSSMYKLITFASTYTVVTLMFVVLINIPKIARQYLRAIVEMIIHSRQILKTTISCSLPGNQTEICVTATWYVAMGPELPNEGFAHSPAPFHACNLAKILIFWQCQECRQALKVHQEPVWISRLHLKFNAISKTTK